MSYKSKTETVHELGEFTLVPRVIRTRCGENLYRLDWSHVATADTDKVTCEACKKKVG